MELKAELDMSSVDIQRLTEDLIHYERVVDELGTFQPKKIRKKIRKNFEKFLKNFPKKSKSKLHNFK